MHGWIDKPTMKKLFLQFNFELIFLKKLNFSRTRCTNNRITLYMGGEYRFMVEHFAVVERIASLQSCS